jgi:polyisoprenoid-binding protein YceI
LKDVIATANLDVSIYPEASFILQESSSDTIRGILTIKGVSKEITFPALVRVDDEKLRIFTEFSIERKHRGLSIDDPEVTPYINLSLERILVKN